ncbi:MAG: dUTP diphosphatase, partial [Lactobacillus sp.]|jgi:dUTP pyrophosphatase|nr:dUTP diphosphatase [Lactobacillus sp.]
VRDCHIRKGERVAQAIFMPILKTDDDQPVDRPRTGGFGSSGKGGY